MTQPLISTRSGSACASADPGPILGPWGENADLRSLLLGYWELDADVLRAVSTRETRLLTR